jgi:hypothetical protein
MWILFKWGLIFGLLMGIRDTQSDLIEGLKKNKANHDLNRRPK